MAEGGGALLLLLAWLLEKRQEGQPWGRHPIPRSRGTRCLPLRGYPPAQGAGLLHLRAFERFPSFEDVGTMASPCPGHESHQQAVQGFLAHIQAGCSVQPFGENLIFLGSTGAEAVGRIVRAIAGNRPVGLNAGEHPEHAAQHEQGKDIATPAFVEPDEGTVIAAAVEDA